MTTLMTNTSFSRQLKWFLRCDSVITAWAIPRPLIAYDNFLIRGFLATVAPKEDSCKRSEFLAGIVGAVVVEQITLTSIANIK